jgi:hypothetical protein
MPDSATPRDNQEGRSALPPPPNQGSPTAGQGIIDKGGQLLIELTPEQRQCLSALAIYYQRDPLSLATAVLQEYIAQEYATLAANDVRQRTYLQLRPADGRGVRPDGSNR